MELEVSITLMCSLEFRPSARVRTDSANTDAPSSAEVPPNTGDVGDTSASQKDEQKRGMFTYIKYGIYNIHTQCVFKIGMQMVLISFLLCQLEVTCPTSPGAPQ